MTPSPAEWSIVRELIQAVKDVGFPVAVAFFVLWRLDNRLMELIGKLEAWRMEEVLNARRKDDVQRTNLHSRPES